MARRKCIPFPAPCLSIGDRVVRAPQEWFLNTPVLWLAAGLLITLLRGPLRNAPALLRKPMKLGLVTLAALGLLILLVWDPVIRASKESRALTSLWILLLGLTPIGWVVFLFRTVVSRAKPSARAVPLVRGAPPPPRVQPKETVRNVRTHRFADIGGMDDAKEQIPQVVQAHVNPGKYARYGLIRNGILLYGPRGSGKTFLARATAGEFGINFESVPAAKLLHHWIGGSAENIHRAFAHAAAGRPVLFFIDEIDSLGAGRQDAISDPGGAGREFNNITMGLMSPLTTTARSQDLF